MNFDAVKTDITNLSVDAIVLPANEQLKEGPGASRAIYEAAGRKELTNACKKLKTCKTGSAVMTLGYNLDADYIIHASVPKWIDGNHDEYELLSSAYLSALNLADLTGCESIAFPLLAAGNNHFDKDLAIRIAEESIHSFQPLHLKKVIVAVYDQNSQKAMESLGYTVSVIPQTLKEDKQKEEQRRQNQKDRENFQEAAINNLKSAAIWIAQPDNQQMMMNTGKQIVQFIKSVMSH